MYIFIINYNKFVENIQKQVKKNFNLKLFFKLTIKVLQICEKSITIFFNKIINFAINLS